MDPANLTPAATSGIPATLDGAQSSRALDKADKIATKPPIPSL
jgi:hypothetical protein